MPPLKPSLLSVAASLLFCLDAFSGVSAVVITYQPIITGGEATVIESPKGFTIMAVPFLSYHFHGKPAYNAISLPYELLTDAPRSVRAGDANLVSAAGVRISAPLDDKTVYVRFEDLRRPTGLDIGLDDVAEATLECIRRVAHEANDRPKLKISGRSSEEEKWQLWEKTFSEHDLAKPFKRPGT
jgi:hypothetical protein